MFHESLQKVQSFSKGVSCVPVRHILTNVSYRTKRTKELQPTRNQKLSLKTCNFQATGSQTLVFTAVEIINTSQDLHLPTCAHQCNSSCKQEHWNIGTSHNWSYSLSRCNTIFTCSMSIFLCKPAQLFFRSDLGSHLTQKMTPAENSSISQKPFGSACASVK